MTCSSGWESNDTKPVGMQVKDQSVCSATAACIMINKQTYLTTLHYNALHYTTLHYITLLHCITFTLLITCSSISITSQYFQICLHGWGHCWECAAYSVLCVAPSVFSLTSPCVPAAVRPVFSTVLIDSGSLACLSHSPSEAAATCYYVT
jgi:hypothetical protein